MNDNASKSNNISESDINEFTNVILNPNSFQQIYSIILRRLKTTTREC